MEMTISPPQSHTELHVLLLEDNPLDAEMEIAVLEEAGFTCHWRRVETRDAFFDALAAEPYDLVLADFSLPSFDGLNALKLFRRKGHDIPFILVSGTLGEEIAIESIKSGATDYILKDRLSRLGLVVRRALQEREDTRRRRFMEEALSASEERFRSFFEYASIGMTIGTLDLRFLMVNDALCRMLGYGKEEMFHMTFQQISHPEELADDRAAVEAMIAGKIPSLQRMKRFLRRDGAVVWGMLNLSLVRDIENRPLAFSAQVQDMSEKRLAEDALRSSEERYRLFFEEDLTGDFLARPDGVLTACNLPFARMFGFFAVEEAVGMNWRDFFPSPQAFAEWLHAVRERRKLEYHETVFRSRDGRLVYAVENIIGRFSRNGELLEIKGYIFDDTRRKKLEQQLIQAQKMESIGTLASGIAHDFNNILGIIQGASSLLALQRENPEKFQARIEAIQQAVARGSEMVRQLLTFARKTEVQLQPLHLPLLIREVLKLLGETFPKNIVLQAVIGENPPPILADSGQIHQVLLNLSVNARDAMSDGGTLTITLDTMSGEELQQRFPNVTAHTYLYLGVSDTGIGIAESALPHIFEPFYTTKEAGRGTGLGLATVFGIVHGHQGLIDVTTAVGRGTTFHIFFPAMIKPAAMNCETRSDWTRECGGNETILVVDDERGIREALREVLERKGYRVVAASDGLDAVACLQRHRAEVALAVMDVGLPGMSGEAAVARMREIRPDLPVLWVSGYLEPQQRARLLDAGGRNFLPKPYSMGDMLLKVREVLNARPH